MLISPAEWFLKKDFQINSPYFSPLRRNLPLKPLSEILGAKLSSKWRGDCCKLTTLTTANTEISLRKAHFSLQLW
jgi:hypothetical protein